MSSGESEPSGYYIVLLPTHPKSVADPTQAFIIRKKSLAYPFMKRHEQNTTKYNFSTRNTGRVKKQFFSPIFASDLGDLRSIPGHVIPKTLKMVLDTSLLNTQHGMYQG